MKDLGDAAYILGIKIHRDRSKRVIGLSQSEYIDKILKKFSMHDSKKGCVPMNHLLAFMCNSQHVNLLPLIYKHAGCDSCLLPLNQK